MNRYIRFSFSPHEGLLLLLWPHLTATFSVLKEFIRSIFGLYFSLILTSFIHYVKPHVPCTYLYVVSVLPHVGVLFFFKVLFVSCVVYLLTSFI